MNSILTVALMNMLSVTANIPTDGWPAILFWTVELIPAITLVPRFILGLRALYARHVRGRRGSEIGTAFGFTSSSGHGAVASAIMFADAGQNEMLEQDEEIQMEDREISSAGSGV